MWSRIEKVFGGFPAQKRVALYLLEKGLGVHGEGKIVCDGCTIPSTSLARRLSVDRRVVDSTAKKILGDNELKRVFMKIKPIAHLVNVAPEIGLGVVSVSVSDAKKPGIIESITDCIARHGVSIRQAVAEDPVFVDDPKFIVITDGEVRGALVEELKGIKGVNQISIS